MEEKEEKQEKEENKTEEKQEIDLIAEAKKEREANLKVLEQMTAERKKMEKLQADLMIGGRSPIMNKGNEKKEETPKEYKDRVMRGEI